MKRSECLLIALAIMAPVGCGPKQEERLVVTQDPSDASSTMCDVKFATFHVPKGWSANRSNKNTFAILSRSDETHPNLSQMVSIDIGKPTEPTVRASAQAFAEQWGGQLEDDKVKVDGEKGFRVTIPPDKTTVRPIDCVITMKDGRLFLIIGGAKQTGEVNTAIDEVVASWKWKN